jgi:antitoxin HicB
VAGYTKRIPTLLEKQMITKALRKKKNPREDAKAIAVKRLLVGQLAEAMKDQKKTKFAMACELRTSRAYLDRLLDPQHTTVSLLTITRAASVLGKRVIFTISDEGKEPHSARPFAISQ